MSPEECADIPWFTQVGSSCVLISLLNAALYHKMDAPRPGTPEFEELTDLIGSRYGAALEPDKAMEKLGLTAGLVDFHPDNFTEKLPVELSVSTEEWGFHSVLAIAVEWRGDDGACVLIANLKKEEPLSWIPFSDLGNLLTFGLRIGGHVAASIQPRNS